MLLTLTSNEEIMKDILVTGGAGFIGSSLVKELVKSGNNVTIFDNLSTGSLRNLKEIIQDIDFIQGDIKNLDLVKNAVRKKEIIYHFAAEVGVDRVLKKDNDVCETDYLAAVDLFELSSKSGIELLIFASSSEVYGKFPQDRLPMKEADRFTPDTIYGWAKYGAEMRLKEMSEKTGMAGISLRYFNVYGPRQTLNGYCVPSFVDFCLKNEDIAIHGDGSQTRDLTYLDDAVRMTLAVADPKYRSEVFNIGTKKEVTMMNLASMIQKLSESKSSIKFIEPRRPTDLYHKMGDATKILDITGIKAEVGLTEGLTNCIEYCRKHPL